MPSKTEEYLALAQRTANGLTRYWESWTDYLTTASRLYKYPFADQLMIYAQRPDATACADFDIWNNRMNRYVRRGAKGIALLDESSGFPRLHYVFDVSDTGVRRNSRDPEVWQFNDDLKQPVSEMLNKTYGISGERVSQQRHQAHHPRRCQHHRRCKLHPQPDEHELRHQALSFALALPSAGNRPLHVGFRLFLYRQRHKLTPIYHSSRSMC